MKKVRKKFMRVTVGQQREPYAWDFCFLTLFLIKKIEMYLIYNVLVLGIHQSDSVIHIYINIFFSGSFPL